MCGEVKSKEKEKTTSTPLVTVSDLQRMEQWETIVLRLRTMPYKTKLTPNYKMNWGHNYPKAVYPKRETKEVKVFNIKDFVTKKREEKINNMLGTNNASSDGGMSFNPFMPPKAPNMPSNDKDFDVDELVKRIDAKIAELEEEEKREQEKLAKENEQDLTTNNINLFEEKSDNVESNVQISKDTETSTNIKNEVTDDQFFDDFFDDN